MPESALIELLQRTFDAVQDMRTDLTTALNNNQAQDSRLTKVETQLGVLLEAHTATRLEVVALKSGRLALGGTSVLGGAGLGQLLQALLGGLVLAALCVSCAGAPNTLTITSVSGQCNARVAFDVAGQPAHFDMTGHGSPAVDPDPAKLVGMVRLWVGPLYAECKGTETNPTPACNVGLGVAPEGAGF
ncbi:MAG: hypothetical protein KAI73_11075 [Rhodospirillaceae bacterium]|nr:hypothetical protein [Rhodospirillaceae bacterium]